MYPSDHKSPKLFSLIELSAAVAVLALVVSIAFQFFSATQKVWAITESNRSASEDARIALDLIARDLQCAYYGNDNDGYAPFWHWRPTNPASANSDGWGQYSNELIAFVSNTPIPPNTVCVSKLCEIKYQKHYTTSHDTDEGWLERSVTGDRLSDPTRINPHWNFFNNLTVSFGDPTTTNAAFTANSYSSEDYQKLIPFVTDFKIDCYDISGNLISPDSSTVQTIRTSPLNSFPYSVTVSITLFDHSSWQKWIGMSGAAADSFRANNQKTFTRTVYIGGRGQ